MNGTERIRALLQGKPVDKAAAATWEHFPAVDRNPDTMAKAVIEYAERRDYDLIKVQMNAAYVTEAYGADITFFSHPPIKYQKIKKLYQINTAPVNSLAELQSLRPIQVKDSPVLQRDVEAVKKIVSYYQGTKPVLPTLFSAYTWLHALLKDRGAALGEYIQADRKAVHRALGILNDLNRELADAYIEAGADGFFFATSYTSPLAVSHQAYEEFNKAYDKPLLEYIDSKTWFNMLHIHGNADLYIEDLVQYPVESINWENTSFGVEPSRLTSAAQLSRLTDKLLIGGTDQFHDFYGTREEVEKRLTQRFETLYQEIPDHRFVFGAGCSLPLDIPEENIDLIRKVVDNHPF